MAPRRGALGGWAAREEARGTLHAPARGARAPPASHLLECSWGNRVCRYLPGTRGPCGKGPRSRDIWGQGKAMEQNGMESWAPATVTFPRDPLRGQLLESQTRVRETCWALLPSALASRHPWSLVSLLSQPSQTLHHQSLSSPDGLSFAPSSSRSLWGFKPTFIQ